MEPDISAAPESLEDREERVALMEPLLVTESSRHRTELTDLALELAQRAAGFRHSLPEGVLTALADLVRALNCYYSNLIEGHDTHPVDIERALKNDYSTDPVKRNLQLEARAHIAVQKWIDEGGRKGRSTKRWAGFTTLLIDGRVCVTNNAAERALRDLALGRKSWLFAGSDRGGERAAVMYTLIVTAKLNGVDPQAWLADVLGRIAGLPQRRLPELLPWNWSTPAEQRQIA